MAAVATTNSLARNAFSLFRSILIAGLVIGVVGSVEFGVVFFAVMHMTPIMLFQYIASALMGMSAFAGGYTTALLGVLMHFVIAFVAAAIFLLPAARFRFLRRTVFLSALVYGSLFNIIMSMVVIPMTSAPKIPVSLPLLLNGLIGDAIFIGLPLATVVWWNTHTVAITEKSWLGDERAVVGA